MILNGSNKLTKRETTALEDSWLSFEGGLKGYLLQNVDEVLQTRGGGQGLKLYDKLYDDPHVQAVMNKLASAVTSKDWIVAPGGEKRIDQKAADLVRSQLANLNAFDLSPKEENHSSVNGFDQLTRAMIVSGRLNGYVCAETMWANRGDQTAASEIRVRDPRQFGFMRGEYGYVLRHLTRENSWTGETPPLKKILVWSYGALDGSPYGRALGKAIFWPVFFKKSITRFDLKFLERFASPKPTGKYPRGATPQQIAELRAALSAIADETEIAIPEGMLIEYLEAASSGTMDAYERSLRYWDEQISEAVLGETGSTNQGGSGGSRARDQVGNEVRIEISKAIADSLSSTFNRLARWITEYNVPGAMPPTVYRDFGESEDLNTRSTRDKTLFDLGYRIDAPAVASVYGEGYVEAGATDKPALISSLGVGGVQALTGLLTQAATGQLPKENAIAVLVSVFGIAEEAAAKMVPDAPEKTPETNPLDQLFGGQDGGAGQQPPDPNATPQFAEQLRHPKGDPKGGQFAKKTAVTNSFEVSQDKKKIKAAFENWKESIERLKSANTANIETKIKHYERDLSEIDQKKKAAKLPNKEDVDVYVQREIEYERKNNNRLFEGDPDLPDYIDRVKSRFLAKAQSKIDSSLDDSKKKDKDIEGKIKALKKDLEVAKKNRVDLGFSDDHSTRISSLVEIHSQIELTLSSPNSRFSGIFDKDGNLQALANLTRKKGHIYIDYLMTAPHNLIPGDPRAAKGSGSAAIESVINLSADSGRLGKVKLTALRDAVPFYKKIGFSERGQGDALPKMDLSPDAAREFMRSRGKTVDFTENELNDLEDLTLGALAMLTSPSQTEFAEAEQPDTAELIAAKARPFVQDAIAPWLDTITNFVEQATSLEEIRDGLIDLFPEMNDAAFAEAMGQAMLLGDLAGREEVLGDDADVAFAEAIEAALSGTLDFAAKPKAAGAAGKKPNCNPAKSHFCQSATGKGSCVPLSKVCKYPPTGLEKKAADWRAEKVPTVKPVAKTKAKTKTIKVEPTTDSIKPIGNSNFPPDVNKLKTIKPLGGSTGAVLVKDPATGKKYVKKMGASSEHIREEYTADKVYEALGINVPKAHLYETLDGPIKLTEYIEGVPLGKLKGKAKDNAIAELQKGFAADALLGNWDVAGLQQDNVLMTKEGKVYRIDNGGALRYRAQGKIKQGTEWNDYPTELWSMRDAKTNPSSAKVFNALNHAEVVRQIGQVTQKRQSILNALPDDLKLTMGKRLDEMERTAKIGKTFAEDGWNDDYTSEFSRHSMGIRQKDCFGAMASKLKGKNKSGILKDENGKEFDNLRGNDSVLLKLDNYITQDGGDYKNITGWLSAQSGSSWAGKSLTYKYFLSEQRNKTDELYWSNFDEALDEVDPVKTNAKKKYDDNATEQYKKTMTAWHAANYEMLDRLDFPNKNEDGTVTLIRTINGQVAKKNKLKKGQKNALIQQAAYDSTSLQTAVKVNGTNITIQKVPLHRIVGTYLTSKAPKMDGAGFLKDSENEFVAILDGIPFDYKP